ncbi:MAG: transposase [Pirellulaceae bacterium]|nr:transposase [Pirellulaceae bacterium]
MGRKSREWTPDQHYLSPPSTRDWLPQSHLVYFLLDVPQRIDITPIVDDYDSEKGGQPPHHPRMMLVLLLYAYCVGVVSSRKITAGCETDVAFRVIVGDDIPTSAASPSSAATWSTCSFCSRKFWRCVAKRDS